MRNALNFTSEGQVTVHIDPDAVEVRDSGAGIGDIDGTALFRPYVRGANSEGTGLGLSLVQRLCEHHGWQVSLANLPGGGTLARVVFARSDTAATGD
jgi:signal transduction histidine kinase